MSNLKHFLSVDGSSHALPSGDCSQVSSGECNNNGGVKDCVGYGHPNPR
jgi:hypothetical protein